jgi:glyoxylase-like metal-dependent hydrolase (beta-lactamase superfamily II)
MKELAPGVFHINCMPLPNAVNCFLLDDVLVDAGGRGHGKRILKSLQGHTVTAHALTHAHADHQGASKQVCETLGIPFWAPELDADAAEDPRLIKERQPDHPISQLMIRMFTGPGHKVDRQLKEGDEVGSFKVLFTPGHSRGHVSYWRESDRVLVLGDVLNNQDPLLGIPGLRLPKNFFTPDPVTNRASAKKLGELEPKLVLFGHGGALRDTKKFVESCAKL